MEELTWPGVMTSVYMCTARVLHMYTCVLHVTCVHVHDTWCTALVLSVSIHVYFMFSTLWVLHAICVQVHTFVLHVCKKEIMDMCTRPFVYMCTARLLYVVYVQMYIVFVTT